MTQKKMADNIRQELQKLNIAREALGLSQEALAATIGTSQQVISEWERGVKCPNSENQKRISAWLEDAMRRLGSEETEQVTAEAANIAEPTVYKVRKKLTPETRQRIVEELKAGRTHREIRADTGVNTATISKVRREEAIPVKSPDSKQADYIYKLWDDARSRTRSFNPSKLSQGEKISFGMGLADIMMWLRRYIERNVPDIKDAQKLTEEVKNSFWR